MPPAHRPYRVVLQVVVAVWLIVAVSTVAWKWSAASESNDQATAAESKPLSTQQIAMIALASGFIGIVAILPGWSILLPQNVDLPSQTEANRQNEPIRDVLVAPSDAAHELSGGASPMSPMPAELPPLALAIERLGHAFLIGMMIRLAGTVALFLASSYYMDAAATRIGIWVLGWHLLLLLSEVIILSRQIRVPAM